MVLSERLARSCPGYKAGPSLSRGLELTFYLWTVIKEAAGMFGLIVDPNIV